MAKDKKKDDDFSLDSFSGNDLEFDDLFKDEKNDEKLFDDIIPEKKTTIKSNTETQKRKRTIYDFEPDMDALLLTAQSSMIIEGMNYYKNRDFSPHTLQIYLEALRGVELYIKIINRNPNNYRKLKTQIDADMDCQQVEKIAFNLFNKAHDDIPETDREKLNAFEQLHTLLKGAVQKAIISNSMRISRNYFLISGGIDTDKLHEKIDKGDVGFKKDIKDLHQHLKMALEMLNKGKSEITEGLKGRDLNLYIKNTAELLSYYYNFQGNDKVSDYYKRIHNIHKKYFIIKD